MILFINAGVASVYIGIVHVGSLPEVSSVRNVNIIKQWLGCFSLSTAEKREAHIRIGERYIQYE